MHGYGGDVCGAGFGKGGGGGLEDGLQDMADLGLRSSGEGGEGVKSGVGEDVVGERRNGGKEACGLEVGEEDDGVVEAGCALGGGMGGRGGNAVGEIVDGEVVRVGGRGHFGCAISCMLSEGVSMFRWVFVYSSYGIVGVL